MITIDIPTVDVVRYRRDDDGSVMRGQFIWWEYVERMMSRGYSNIELVPIFRTAGKIVISLVYRLRKGYMLTYKLLRYLA